MRRLRVGDRNVRVRDEGESKRPALVCVHGAGSSSVVWMDLVRRLSPQRRVVAPDLPGHGQSDRWHPPAEVTIDMYRDAVGTICARLEIGRAVLIGHSMGALVALAAAAAWPERVTGLVLVGGGPRLPVAAEVFAQLATHFAGFPTWMGRVAWSPATPLDTVERWGAVAFTADQEVTSADFRAVDRFDGEPLLARVRAPTLAITGADDLLAPPARTRALAAGIAGARAVVVPQAGHMVVQEQPDRFLAELHDLLIAATG